MAQAVPWLAHPRVRSGPAGAWLNARGLRTTRGGVWPRASVLKLLGNRV